MFYFFAFVVFSQLFRIFFFCFFSSILLLTWLSVDEVIAIVMAVGLGSRAYRAMLVALVVVVASREKMRVWPCSCVCVHKLFK